LLTSTFHALLITARQQLESIRAAAIPLFGAMSLFHVVTGYSTPSTTRLALKFLDALRRLRFGQLVIDFLTGLGGQRMQI